MLLAATLYSHAGQTSSLYDITEGGNGYRDGEAPGPSVNERLGNVDCQGTTASHAAPDFDGPSGIGASSPGLQPRPQALPLLLRSAPPNQARNAIAHADEAKLAQLRAGGFPLVLDTYRRWRHVRSPSKVGIEETHGSPRPWIFEREEARRRRRALALGRIRKLLGKLTLPHRTR